MYAANFTEIIPIALKEKRMQLTVKRGFDIIASLLGMIAMSPLFIVMSVLIKLDTKGPVIFKQERVGKMGKLFKIYKFRTMFENADSIEKQLTVGADARITKVGRFLRKYRLDEFAQLFNVLKGDMSLVGPRPEVPKYAQLYQGLQRQVFMVRPGITDYASIEYKDESELLGQSADPEEMYANYILPGKIELKLKYLNEISLLIDIKIIFLTFIAIFKRRKSIEHNAEYSTAE